MRIVIPYLCWTIIYISAFLVKDTISGEHRDYDWIGIFFYGQSAVHLYFLPVLISLQFAILAAYSTTKNLNHPWVSIAIACMAVIILFMHLGHSGEYLGWPTPHVFIFFIIAAWALEKNHSNLLTGRLDPLIGIDVALAG